MVATLTAHRRLPSLLTSLQRSGWGPLAERELQGVRATLVGLVGTLPHGSAQGLVTVAQVADATGGLSTKWVARCLAVLEDMGLLEWRRGGVVAGTPQPSWIRLHKDALVALIEQARPMLAAVLAVRKAITDARLEGIAYISGRKRRSAHVELSAHLHPLTGEVSTSPPVGTPPDNGACPHDEPRGPAKCPLCRRGIS